MNDTTDHTVIGRSVDKPAPPLKGLLDQIRVRGSDIGTELGAAAQQVAAKHSEARRDAILAVALAIKRRGDNPLSDWTTHDKDAAYAIAEQLIALDKKAAATTSQD